MKWGTKSISKGKGWREQGLHQRKKEGKNHKTGKVEDLPVFKEWKQSGR